MSKDDQGAPRAQAPVWWQTAQRLYKDSFGAKDSKELGAAMKDWQELSDDERQFYLAHLAWLNLHAQLGITRLLLDIRDELTEHGDLLEQMQDLDELPPEPRTSGGDEDGWIEPQQRASTAPTVVPADQVEVIVPGEQA